MIINISVVDKRPTVDGSPVIVCGNSGYSIKFAFDEEWTDYNDKTARFVFHRNGEIKHIDVPFSGDTVAVPKLSNIREVSVGVYAGDLHTTTPARISCAKSILCDSGDKTEAAPAPGGTVTKISVTEAADGTVTMVNTLTTGGTETLVIAPDANGNPGSITYNGVAVPIEWVVSA